MEAEVAVMPLLKGGHETRKTDSQEGGKGKEWLSLKHPQKEHSPTDTWISARSTLFRLPTAEL